MKRQARCWICGTLFEAERGSLPKGARFTCEGCANAGLRGASGEEPDRTTLARVLYEKHGVPYVDLKDMGIDDEVLRLVAEDFARHHSLIPVTLKVEEDDAKPKKGAAKPAAKATTAKPADPGKKRPVALIVAMTNPSNRFAIESIRRRIGIPVQPCVSTWAEIAEAIGDHYLKIALTDEPVSEPE